MLKGAKDPVAQSAADVEDLLAGQSSKKNAKLPKRLQRDIDQLRKTAQNARNQPYRLKTDAAFSERTHKRVAKHVERHAERVSTKSKLTNWLAGVVLNLLILAVVIAAFWYVATQM